MSFPWRLPAPFTETIAVEPSHIDGFGHVNNAVYIQWLERIAWAHSSAVGLPLSRCVELERGMAIRRTEVDFLGSAFLGDVLVVGSWIVSASRLRAARCFEIFRQSDGAKVLAAQIEFVCINLKTGLPSRFPDPFVEGYRVEQGVAEAMGAQGQS